MYFPIITYYRKFLKKLLRMLRGTDRDDGLLEELLCLVDALIVGVVTDDVCYHVGQVAVVRPTPRQQHALDLKKHLIRNNQREYTLFAPFPPKIQN